MRTVTLTLRTALLVLLISVTACSDQPPDITRPTSQPEVFSLSPNSSPFDISTTTVVLKGAGFKQGATVSVGGAATDVTVRNSSEIIATVPAHPIGVVDVIVTNPDVLSG